jgi:hypothetical protein
MGRPKGAANKVAAKAAEPKQPEPAKAVSKADMVRAALADGIDKPGEGVAFIKAKFGIDLPKPMWSSYVAQQKARDRQSAEPATRTTKPKPAVLPVTKHGGGGETDLITAMEAIKPYVVEHGAERLKRIIDLLG